MQKVLMNKKEDTEFVLSLIFSDKIKKITLNLCQGA